MGDAKTLNSRLAIAADLAVVIAACLLLPRAAPGASCGESVNDWEVVRGSLRDAGKCGDYFIATDGESGTFSYADILYKTRMRVPLDLEVTWRRLGPETGRAMELHAVGALVLVRDGGYGFYTWNDATFAWVPLPGYHQHDEHRIAVHQTATEIALSIDGARVGSFPFAAPPEGRVGVAAKGAGGYRSWIEARSFRAASAASSQ